MLLGLVSVGFAQDPIDVIVQIEVDTSDGVIVLSFDDRQPVSKTVIYRQAPSIGDGWRGSDTVATLTAGETSWTDPDALPGEVWEYDVQRVPTDGSPPKTQGIVAAALDAPLVDDRGLVVLIVDATIAAPLAGKIDRLTLDLVGDGYQVRRHDVARELPVTEVKSLVVADVAAADGEVTVFLLGHVPVPYSGAINPDGHPDHYGAWPADLYYAELDDPWNDTSVNTTVASRVANQNVPGDGKFDASVHSSDVDLMLGRVDLSNLPAFGALDEVALLARYLDKDHAWRQAEVAPEKGVLIDDNFGAYAPAAKSGWALAPLVGRDGLTAGDWLTTLPTTSHLWAFGSGGGSYTSASGVATTTDFVNNPINAVFTMIFGSYHGDWDAQDALLRAAIAADGLTLTSAWAGRPNWWHHPMAVGETIGFVARWAMNNTEQADYGARFVHVSLLGDPTLRLHPVAPVSDVVVTADEGHVAVSWAPSASPALLGYHVYLAPDPLGPYTRVTDAPVADPALATTVEAEGTWHVQVRAIEMTRGFGGSYENNSQGAFGSVEVVCEGDGTVCAEPDVADTDEGDPKGCGCDSPGAPGGALLGLVAVAARRRRR